jgi:hypothetical protein
MFSVQGALSHRVTAEPKALPVKGAPNAFAVVSRCPSIGTPVAVVWHGAVLVEAGADELEGGIAISGVRLVSGANGFVVGAPSGGLRPPTAISVEPNGIPTPPTDGADPIPVPDEATGAGPAEEPPPAAQVPEAVPLMPPPSKSAVAVPDAAEKAPHVARTLVAGVMGDVADMNGLTPGDASSVAPMGILVGATGEAGPRPSGDVMPSGGPGEMLVPPICADAEPQSKRTADRTASAKRVIMGLASFCTRRSTAAWLYTGATQLPFCSRDDRLREITPNQPHRGWTASRSSMTSRRCASLHLRLQNFLPHQRCVTIPNGPLQ